MPIRIPQERNVRQEGTRLEIYKSALGVSADEWVYSFEVSASLALNMTMSVVKLFRRETFYSAQSHQMAPAKCRNDSSIGDLNACSTIPAEQPLKNPVNYQ